ncbi:MAG: DNA mismatch repair protein MutS [Desulfurivibrionaceae bacterium]|nr:DNA mismatch repair protein MutS [Desulfurivibrionaceae bacterium]
MSKKAPKITPMMQQYLEIKQQHPDAILFYRLGDFYEMFFEDAVTASRVLGITLTSRNHKDDDNKIPLCGVPHHAAPAYLARLVEAGFRVAICEQVEDPKTAKGVVRREVARVVSPGVVTDAAVLDDKCNRYLASIARGEEWGYSLLDISTGEFLVAQQPELAALFDELARLGPAEILLPDNLHDHEEIQEALACLGTVCLTVRPNSLFHPETAGQVLLEHFQTTSMAGFGCAHLTSGLAAAGALLAYVQETQKSGLAHIERLIAMETQAVLMLDESSRRNLELTKTIIGAQRQGSLLHTLDFTKTPMGSRLLARNLLFPLRDPVQINKRLDTVAYFHGNEPVQGDFLARHNVATGAASREELRELLAGVYDLERLNSRVVLGSANGRDLIALSHSLARLPRLCELCATSHGILQEESGALDLLADIQALLCQAIREDAPVGLREGRLINRGFHAELDGYLALLVDGKKLILGLEAQERQSSGIAKLKIGFNKVFGYFIEVSKAQAAKVPDHYIRKQTLVNAERYITPELKEFEEKVLVAEEKRLELEYRLFVEIRNQVAAASSRILAAASFVAQADYYTCLAEAARRYHFRRPRVDDGDEIIIKEGRHPVIEAAMAAGRFVPNDIHLDQSSQEVLIITGPNMAGKSTVLRQTALITLMAQMGSFVPAREARIGVVDRIFTRVGAMDDLRRGQSTFMVEMNETANILNNATENSLVILDEIGRGTSTFDGLAIAWAVTEDLVAKNGKGVKTIFATHYHELIELARTHKRVKNFHIGVREWDDTIIFLHKLLPGGTSRSYGIQVAALAGVPRHVVERAKELLHDIESGEFATLGQPPFSPAKGKNKGQPSQLDLFPAAMDGLRQRLAGLDVNSLTPLDALQMLYRLKDEAQG